MIFCIFYQVDNLFLRQSYLKNPLPVKLAWYKMQTIVFIIEKIHKYRNCPALLQTNLSNMCDFLHMLHTHV